MKYFDFHKKYVKNLSIILNEEQLIVDIKAFVLMLKKAKKDNKTIYICGNGGHASTSNHFATDLCTLGIRAISLTANPSEVTRLANDFGYDRVFDKQLLALDKGDIVVGISASGNSMNVVNAMKLASEQRAKSVAMVGFVDGGTAKAVAKHSLHAISKKGEYGLVEDAHMTICHIISFYLANG